MGFFVTISLEVDMDAMHTTDQFLDVYKRLERAIKETYGVGADTSPIYYLQTQRKEFNAYRHILHTAREVRNLLQHNEKINGEYPITVSEELLAGLEACYSKVIKPIAAKDICVPSAKILSASWDDGVYDVYKRLIDKGFEHCPILNDGRVEGVFGADVIGGLFKDSASIDLSSYTLNHPKIRELVSREAHKGEYFGFIAPSMRYDQIDDIFDKAYIKGIHYVMLFVTASGGSEERIQGLLTAYDMVGYRES